MGTKDNEGDNPTNDRLVKTVNDYVLDILRLEYAGTPEEMDIEPQLVTDSYNYIKHFPESKLTHDSVGTVHKDINTYFRHSLNPLSKEEIIEATCKTFLTSVKLLKFAMYSLDEAVSTRKLEEQLSDCKAELDQHRVNIIELQQTLIKNQQEQLSSMTNSVQKVKAYSTVLAQNVAAVSPVVRKSAQDPTQPPSSERDKNLVIFGLPETTDRLTKNSVDGLFAELNEQLVLGI